MLRHERASPCGSACMCLGACAYLRAACIAAAVVESGAAESERRSGLSLWQQ